MAARRTAASLAIVSHSGVPKLAASPQLKPEKRKWSMRKQQIAVGTILRENLSFTSKRVKITDAWRNKKQIDQTIKDQKM